MKKYEWTKPKVTVLVKTNTQEQVLAACKFTAVGGPSTQNSACQALVVGCSDCSANVIS